MLEKKEITFPDGTENYYDVAKARERLESPIPDGCTRWHCILCGFPQGDFKKEFKYVGAFCCGGCGMSCVRPIDEY